MFDKKTLEGIEQLQTKSDLIIRAADALLNNQAALAQRIQELPKREFTQVDFMDRLPQDEAIFLIEASLREYMDPDADDGGPENFRELAEQILSDLVDAAGEPDSDAPTADEEDAQ